MEYEENSANESFYTHTVKNFLECPTKMFMLLQKFVTTVTSTDVVWKPACDTEHVGRGMDLLRM